MNSVLEKEPFLHLHAQHIISSEQEKNLLLWLEGSSGWLHKVEDFYGMDLSASDHCDASAMLCSRPFLFTLKKLMEQWFDVTLSSKIRIWAHLLRPGNGIGIHNDNTPNEFRFVLQLNSGWEISQGGFTLLIEGKNPHNLKKAVIPASNTALAFRTDAFSYHAVSEVRAGNRYSLVFVFTELEG